jgi:hypothetical protein
VPRRERAIVQLQNAGYAGIGRKISVWIAHTASRTCARASAATDAYAYAYADTDTDTDTDTHSDTDTHADTDAHTHTHTDTHTDTHTHTTPRLQLSMDRHKHNSISESIDVNCIFQFDFEWKRKRLDELLWNRGNCIASIILCNQNKCNWYNVGCLVEQRRHCKSERIYLCANIIE